MLDSMAKLDFWWDESAGNPGVDFRSVVNEVMAWRPATEIPTLAVLGNTRHFRSSALAKSIGRTGLVRAVNFDDLPDADIHRPDVALLRWGYISPWQRARLSEGVRVSNDTHLDTDKANVDQKFAAVAGYSSLLDPAAESGLAIVKSRQNARHDGRIRKLPLDTFDPDDVICQRLIGNTLGEYVADIRVPFVLGNPVLAYVKIRECSRRFDNANAHARLVMPSEVLTTEEIRLCQRFCDAIGLDYGELDILRDGREGRIYIVDANDGPAGPTKVLPEIDRTMAFRLVATAFRKYVFGQPC